MEDHMARTRPLAVIWTYPVPTRTILSLSKRERWLPGVGIQPIFILTALKRTKYNRKHILDIGLQYELHNCIALF